MKKEIDGYKLFILLFFGCLISFSILSISIPIGKAMISWFESSQIYGSVIGISLFLATIVYITVKIGE